jgi:cardiolipin synthase
VADSVEEAAARAASAEALSASPTSRVWTVPNALSFLRLLGVPLFGWLVLGPHADGWALTVLILSGLSDWLDGALARRWNQMTRLGQLLDPAADRLYVVVALGALAGRGIIPWVLAIALIGRDVVLAGFLPLLRRHGYGPLPVSFLGKAATANLLYAFPMLLIGAGHGAPSDLFRPLGWAFAGWGTALYWWAGVLYAGQVRRLVSAA